MVEAPAEPHQDEEADGEEKPDASRSVYNVTFAHPKLARAACGRALKPPGSYTQKQLIAAMLDAVQKTQGPRLSALALDKNLDPDGCVRPFSKLHFVSCVPPGCFLQHQKM